MIDAAGSLIVDFRHELVSTVLISLFIGGALYPFRSAKKKWDSMMGKLDAVHAELTEQRTNCLATLQTQGDTQVKLLGDAVGVLREIHTSQSEMSGFLKGSHRE